MMPYRIFTDATADLSPELLQGLPPVEIIPMQIEIGGHEYSYGSTGSIATQAVYFEHFEPCLLQGIDI